MFDDLTKYKTNGHFFFTNGDSLATVSKGVPSMKGIYYIMRLAAGNIDLVYIGKSGTMQQNGSFKTQSLRGRMNNRFNGGSRQAFFESKFAEQPFEALDIYWYVTMDKTYQDIPGYVEALLLQQYFQIYGKLPPWNKCF
jgi:hypothetical protein